jgi:RHS repeat-associated protein
LLQSYRLSVRRDQPPQVRGFGCTASSYGALTLSILEIGSCRSSTRLREPSSARYDGLDDLKDEQESAGARLGSAKSSSSNPYRKASRTDPLAATETYGYDGNGNLTGHTDRRGETSVYQYDGINRRKFAGFGYTSGSYESTSSYTFDPGDRITQIVDSIAGTTVRQYDGLDDLTDEQTAQGEVGYFYDNARRRQTMTVVGQPTVSYSWDNANRLTGITQGSASIPIAYDNADRRNTLTLPNGIVLAYTYDIDSHVTAMSWTLGSNTVGDLEYSYDADSRVIEKTGSFAQTGLPQAVTGNSFNAANEMTAFNGTPQTYDANGNLTNDGTSTYNWDARNHLTAIAGPNAASFAYDADGRRAQKTINSTSTQFLYDGLNPVQEIQSGAPSANLLTGLGIDEYFQRTDSAGARNYLTDILSSTLGLTDATGSIQTQYSYDPFGNSASSGQASSNPYQFTGRENDGTGLDYYRARYYAPGQARFVGQDPLDFRGGSTDLYSYVRNDPVALFDPLGLFGTGSCQLYTDLCNVFGDPYDCEIAPLICNLVPDEPSTGGNCIRECLQDRRKGAIPVPKNSCGPNPPTDNLLNDHIFCFVHCGEDIDNPYDPGGPNLPDNPSGPHYP